MIRIGIDPGVKTGFAVCEAGKYLEINTLKIHQAMDKVLAYNQNHLAFWHPQPRGLVVYVEDARKRGGFACRAQGAGSVKRDCKIWEDFLIDHKIEYSFLRPDGRLTKFPENRFKRITGWKERTSEHARDAAMLVFQL